VEPIPPTLNPKSKKQFASEVQKKKGIKKD